MIDANIAHLRYVLVDEADAFELSDKKSQGVSLLNQGISLAKGVKQNVPAEARTLFVKAAAISREAGDDANAKLAESWVH